MASETKYPMAYKSEWGDWYVDWGNSEVSLMPDEATARRCAAASEMYDALEAGQSLRAILLKQYGAVPECVLDFCNRARFALSSARGE